MNSNANRGNTSVITAGNTGLPARFDGTARQRGGAADLQLTDLHLGKGSQSKVNPEP
jgi:hypothetical protein